ncbi:MAG: hypothetical protein CMO01_13550 [Thalassobius sp.]|nr:hypothetical protein [Thalassovita sp.]|tara:strand:+ start:276 stop:791 length:516 start_codon:yes stop_codon:yes gene_type:complete
MIKRLLIIICCVCFQNLLFAQIDSLKKIDKIVRKIDSDKKLKTQKFNTDDVYNKPTDGGGIIEIKLNGTEIKKIRQEIGVSLGRLTTVIYMVDGEPIKIIDREENFDWSEEQSTYDYHSVDLVYQAEIYVFDAKQDKYKVISTGDRNLSSGNASLSEYTPLIKLAQDIIEQ